MFFVPFYTFITLFFFYLCLGFGLAESASFLLACFRSTHRPWGLAHGGAEGVRQVMEMIEKRVLL